MEKECLLCRGTPAEVCRAIRTSKAAGRVSELGERTPAHKARKAGAQKKRGPSYSVKRAKVKLLLPRRCSGIIKHRVPSKDALGRVETSGLLCPLSPRRGPALGLGSHRGSAG